MGSLLPGWDQEEGDFLQQSKTRKDAAVPEWLQELRRDPSRRDSSPRRWHTVGDKASTSASGTSSLAPLVPRRASEGVHDAAAGGVDSAASSPHSVRDLRRRYESLRSSTRPSLARSSMPSTLQAESSQGGDVPRRGSLEDSSGWPQSSGHRDGAEDDGLLHRHIKWWQHMNSSHFNRPDTSIPDDYKSGGYTPQTDVANGHHTADGRTIPTH